MDAELPEPYVFDLDVIFRLSMLSLVVNRTATAHVAACLSKISSRSDHAFPVRSSFNLGFSFRFSY